MYTHWFSVCIQRSGKMKKTMALILTLVVASALFVAVHSEGTDAAPFSDVPSEGISWNFDTHTSTLTISGTGPMENYTDRKSVV